MRLSPSLKRNLSVAAALAGLGLLSVTARQTSRQPSQPLRRRPAIGGDSLATLRDELRGVARRAPASGGIAHGREAGTPSEIPARGWWDIAKRTVSQILSTGC
jgi:membrane protein